MTTALDEYWEARDKLAAERHDEDTAAWQTWKQAPTPDTLSPLLARFNDDFGRTIRSVKAPNINQAAMRANLTRHALRAFETYDPTRGASLRTHVNNTLVRVDRFNRDNQNLAYIPEGKSMLIGPIDRAAGQLTEALGRAPTPTEIAAHLTSSGKKTISPKLVQEIQGQRRADIMGSTFQSDPTRYSGDAHEQVVNLLPGTLVGDEQHVFDYMFGRNGKTKVESTGEIARRLGKSPSQISRIRGRIEQKYLRGVK